jgi:hypothetical protein
MSERRTVVILRVAPLLFVLGALALVRPFGDFPLNDDWAYASSVRTLLDDGRLQLSDWVPASTVFHILWGGAWSFATGETHLALRLSVVFWLALGACLLAATARRLGASEGVAALGGLTFAASPLALSFGFTYHTDVPFISLGIATLYTLLRYDDDGTLGWLWLSSACAAAAITTRQIGVGFEAGIIGLLLWRRQGGATTWLAALMLPASATASYLAWIEWLHEATWAMDAYLLEDSMAYLAQPSVWIPETLRRILAASAYAAVFSMPLVVLSRPRWRARQTLALALAGAATWFAFGNWPYFANAFGPRGLGTVTVHASQAKASGFFGWEAFALGLSAAAWCSLAWILSPCTATGGDVQKREQAWLYGGTWLLVFALMLPKSTFFDRYALVLLPPALIVASLRAEATSRGRQAAALASWTLLATISLLGTIDYHAWNEAKWALARRALAHGVAPGDVAAGVDWDAYWTYEPNMTRLKATRPLDQIGRWDWQQMNRRKSLVAFDQRHGAWVRVVDEEPYRTPLSPSGQAVLYRVERPTGVTPR